LDERKWPREAIAMENRANDIRKRSLLAGELMRMGYGGDKKGLGEALQEIDPTAKIPKFKVYGKNNTANELKEIIKDQRLS
jgi:hypothetical protein